ncbi:ABC transporter integral membrane type 1 [Penicillium hordei]|uniref:ABC transporter integral membrane type 1 n=1 Tax=Penicillium hordei TaxID=40994 RepID=A0AAD6GWS4_9EURO|nr:ABC transporter integral membrane type 1 [Penicillium hordei]KAJ5593638.1 ABC transporter integral membrane type 1 [Penicillium hordei]
MGNTANNLPGYTKPPKLTLLITLSLSFLIDITPSLEREEDYYLEVKSNPRVLLPDKATSALDLYIEVTQKALYNACQGHTTITKIYKLATIQDADNIVIIESGRILDTNYSLLKANSRPYSRFIGGQDLSVAEDLPDGSLDSKDEIDN